MDRKYIENEHIVDRYLSGELTVREAREFEQFCLDHPQFLTSLPSRRGRVMRSAAAAALSSGRQVARKRAATASSSGK